MEKLADAVKREAEAYGVKADYNTPLGEAAEKWAVCCIRHFTGERLKLGLEIARALADFDAYMGE